MKTTTLACGIAAAVVASLCLSPGLAPDAWAQTQPAAADTDTGTAPEVSAALDLRARGAWSPSVNYVKDDLVTSRGSAWRAKRANTNKVPGSTLPSTARDWERFAAGFNPLGGWLGSRTYHRDDLVLRQGSTWRALRTNLNKAPGLFPADWQLFAAMGAAGGNSVPSGSAGAPSINFSGDSDTGIFSPSAGKIALVEDGTLFLHNIGTSSTALGASALDSNTTGQNNTALGTNALTANTDGGSNVAVGSSALQTNTIGALNTAVGNGALRDNTGGGSNVAVGNNALNNNETGGANTAVGNNALSANVAGSDNIALGRNAGLNPTAPSSSIFIGNDGLAADTTTIKIGTQGTQTSAFMAGIFGQTSASGIAVLINGSGKLGTTTSSRRYKEDIQPMADASAPLRKLRPVTFRYRQPYEDGSKPLEYGLIAEEVAEVLPDLAVFNADGQPETVKYHLLPSLLLNEVQGQHRTIARQEQTIRSQAEQIAALERRLSTLEAALTRPGRAVSLP